MVPSENHCLFTCQTSILVIFLVILEALSTATHILTIIFLELFIHLKNAEPLKKKGTKPSIEINCHLTLVLDHSECLETMPRG